MWDCHMTTKPTCEMASGGSPSLPSSSGLTSASAFSDSPTVEADLSSSEEETGESQSQEKSILHVLKAPQPLVLARKRTIQCNPPVGVKKSKRQEKARVKRNQSYMC